MSSDTTRVSRLELFAECLLLGVLVTVAALPVVTLPAALAGGCSGVRRLVEHRTSGARVFVGDLRRALRTSASAATAVVGGCAFLGFDALVVVRADLPGAVAVAGVVAATAVAGLVVLLRAAALWRVDGPAWPALLRLAAVRAGADLSGCALLVGALVAVTALTWQLPPLLPLSVGCLLLAAVAVQTRAEVQAGG
jgi:uncharacterized membrane protein YesL